MVQIPTIIQVLEVFPKKKKNDIEHQYVFDTKGANSSYKGNKNT